MRPVRPSAHSGAAKHCGLAPTLAERYPEQGDAALEGVRLHALMEQALSGGGIDPEVAEYAKKIRNFAECHDPEDLRCEVPIVPIVDPRDGAQLTPDDVGRIDIVFRCSRLPTPGITIYVGDFKFGRRAVEAVGNRQLRVYAAALMLSDETIDRVITWIYQPFVSRDIQIGDTIERAGLMAIIDEIRDVAEKDPNTAVSGAHCLDCWQRKHCHRWMFPGVVPGTEAPPVTDEQSAIDAREMLNAWKAQEKRAADHIELLTGQLEAYGMDGGTIGAESLVKIEKLGNRSGPTVRELEQMGRQDLIKPGRLTVKYEWRKR